MEELEQLLTASCRGFTSHPQSFFSSEVVGQGGPGPPQTWVTDTTINMLLSRGPGANQGLRSEQNLLDERRNIFKNLLLESSELS